MKGFFIVLLLVGLGTTPLLSYAMSAEEKSYRKAEIIVDGKVVDENNEPLPGVSIILKGTSIGTTTDVDGRYRIDVPSAESILIFSFIGYNLEEIIVGDQKTINVFLIPDIAELSEVIVTGYRDVKKDLFTGASATVQASETKIDGVVEVGRLLEGRAAGVSVQSISGTFGTSPKIRVRGASSIFGDSRPLWVVDGIVLEEIVNVSPDDLSSGDAATLISSSIAGVNADDIEKYEVLKDASATALYGARAMNGVIVITTKKGKSGSTSINYTGEFTIRQKPSYNNFDLMTSQEQISVYKEMEEKGLLNHATISSQANGGIYRRMYDLINTADPLTGAFLVENTPEGRNAFLQQYELANTDWFDVLFRNSLTQNHSLSMSGGGENSNYYSSLSYYRDEGWSIADQAERITANIKGSFNLNKKVTLTLSSAINTRQQRAPGSLDRRQNVVDGTFERDFDINPFSYVLNSSRALRPYDENGDLEFYTLNYAPFNIIQENNANFLDIDVLDLQVQARLNYDIFNDLSYDFTGSIRYAKTTQEHNILEEGNLPSAYRANGTQIIEDNNRFLFNDINDPNGRPQVVLPQGGFYNRTDNQLNNYYFRNTLNWTKDIDNLHSVNIFAGQELRLTDREEFQFTGAGYQFSKGGQPFVDPRFIERLVQGGFDYYSFSPQFDRFLAYFATGSYSYKSKYTLNLTGRYDGSNLLGSSRSARWLPTWNVSGGWNIANEPFLINSRTVSNLNLRATYGLTASMGPATNATAVFRNQITSRPLLSDRENRIFIESLENSDLTWEKQFEFNLGVDLGLAENKLQLTTDVYQRDGFDLISFVRTSGVGGESVKFANAADMVTRGVEFTLNTKNISREKFNWSTTLTFSHNTNEITELKNEPDVFDLVRSEGGPRQGSPVRGLYSFQFDGLDNDGLPTFKDATGDEGAKLTNINFQTNEEEYLKNLKYEGSIDPTGTGGIANVLNYGNFRLNLFVTYQFGNKIRLDPTFNARYNDLSISSKDFVDRWLVPGDEEFTDIPTIPGQRLIDENPNITQLFNAYNYSDVRVADGGFARLKEISLTYSLPQRFTENIGVKSASVRVQATNLLLLYSDSKLNGQDPEFFGSGGVALPVPRQYTATLRVGL